jgi:chromosomal replication initiator protein
MHWNSQSRFYRTSNAEARGASVTIHDIQRIVAQRFGVTVLDLVSARRGREQARPRQVAMWLSRHTTLHSLPEIGRAFGDRDHSTVIQAIRRVDERMAADADFAGTVWTILQAVDPVESAEIRRMRMRAVA